MTVTDGTMACRPKAVPTALPQISEGEFALLKDLIYRRSGIHLGPLKASLIAARLGRRVRDLGLTSFGEYYDRVMSDDGSELIAMLDRITTNETRFFRERHQFGFLEERVFPEWHRQAAAGARPKRVSAWSAACSTGEEPYSLAMSLLWYFPRQEGWSVQVLASDLSTQALDAARNAVWTTQRAAAVPPRYLRRFMMRGVRTQEGKVRATEELRSAVRFERINLNDDKYPHASAFDLVFARNVLIYFAEGSRGRTLERISACVAPGGYLLVGHAEHAGTAVGTLQHVRPTIYRAATSAAGRKA